MKKVAYLILAHTDPLHFSRLVEALGRECDIYVHIDLKAQIETFEAVATYENVHFLEQRVSISWAGISMIDAQNRLLEAALVKRAQYSHFICLSGSDYPIKSYESITASLDQKSPSNYMRFIDMRDSPDHYINHVRKKWFKEPFFQSNHPAIKFFDKVIRRGLNLLGFSNAWDESIIPCFGSQWCAFNAETAAFLLQYQKEHPEYRAMNEFTFSPDEHYYHTLIANYRTSGAVSNKETFVERGTWRLANLHLIDESLSKWYTLKDWETISDSDQLFIRKVRSADGSGLVDRIDREMLS